MSVEECLKRYMNCINSCEFSMYERTFGDALQRALFCGYRKRKREWDLVTLIEEVINNFNAIPPSNRARFKISTKAHFIHGPKSQVEFAIKSKKTQRELGDIILVISVDFKGVKYFEKITINQVKKDRKMMKWVFSSKSCKEQLYLLSKFPTFYGANKGSLIPGKKYNLDNTSGALGAYILLYRPGDFSYISASKLDSLLENENKKSIGSTDLFLLQSRIRDMKYHHLPESYPVDIEKLNQVILSPSLRVLDNYIFFQNISDFSSNYLRANIGEFIHAEDGNYNKEVRRFFHDLLYSIESKARKEKNEDMLTFINNFCRFGYSSGGELLREETQSNFDSHIGKSGIVHTIVEVGDDEI